MVNRTETIGIARSTLKLEQNAAMPKNILS
jgi:hypothetical protein